MGGAFAVVRATGGLGGLLPIGPATLKVTGTPATADGTWASGVKEAWHVSTATGGAEGGGPRFYNGFFTSTATSWALTEHIGDTGFIVHALDPATGAATWNDYGADKAFYIRSCASEEIGGLVPCLVDMRKGTGFQGALAFVDWRTGEIRRSKSLGDLGVTTPLGLLGQAAIVDGSIVLTLPRYPQQEAENLGELADVTVVRVSADGATRQWSTTMTGCDHVSDAGSPFVRSALARPYHGLLAAGFGVLLNFDTGKSVVDDATCAQPVTDNTLFVFGRGGGVPPKAVAAPDGTSLATVTQGVEQFRKAILFPQPLRLDGGQLTPQTGTSARPVGTANLTAFDPATGAATWAKPVPVAVAWHATSLDGTITYDGHRFLLATNHNLSAIDPTTGTAQWTTRMPYDTSYDTVTTTSDGSIIVHANQRSSAYDPTTGALLWTADGDVVPLPGPDGKESLLQDASYTSHFIARLVPADRPAQAPALPSDAPACPGGLSPVSWTAYSGGDVLVCRQGDTYAVTYPSNPGWHATELNFTPGGFEVVFDNGATVRSSLGGAVIYSQEGGQVTAHKADKTWNAAGGEATLPVPADLPACPAGSWPISLSTFNGGWLLVCGTSANEPTALSISVDGKMTQASSVGFTNGAYCGKAAGDTVCAYRTPALVATQKESGDITQRSVTSNYFAGQGLGGAGKGTGSYGVNAPTADAKDQVRYLTEILQKSAVGRASLDEAVEKVRTCSDVSGAVGTISKVIDNRQELLTALDATPVDAVPNGAALVAKLRKALQLSRDADQIWLQWAQAEQANGCSAPTVNPLYTQVKGMTVAVAEAKSAFVDDWNAQIVPTYGAPRFEISQI